MRNLRGALVTGLVVAVCAVLQTVPATQGAYVGRVTNTTNSAANGIYARCTSAANALGTAFFVLPLDDGSGSTALDVSGHARPGTYVGGVTLDQPGPCPAGNGRAVRLDGSSGFVDVPATQANPQVFSAQVWFRTAPGYARGGRLLGFGDGTGTTPSTRSDRHVYMTAAGRLTFGVTPELVRTTVTTPGAYNDGAWHHVVVTLAPLLDANPGMRVYVDGALVVSATIALGAQPYSGHWRLGWDTLAGWPGAPPSNHFAGWLAYGAVFDGALTPAQVSSLYTARG
ncbi:LamG domain-containing protein [uncultured Nocardioides sp.]|uniref:LamG domain-containing protein n=1 Tax=uncultured Nocardioides sp. TaxID=198441 RepID=UPI002631BC7E|nr:LamG domain-containing protein [uncultured Nocardioides sp.]